MFSGPETGQCQGDTSGTGVEGAAGETDLVKSMWWFRWACE